ncbi:MAG: phytanoyl-CoA dioxygenase family protein [Pseudomonadota bacterium]
MTTGLSEGLEREGFVWFRGLLDEKSCHEMEETSDSDVSPGSRAAPNSSFARSIAANLALNAAAESLGYSPAPVRILSFVKSDSMNWALPWHQDRVVAVEDKADIEGYSNWAKKDGVWHCEPPVEILEKMIFARIHLDPADAANGCLEIAPGTHELGVIPADEASKIAAEADTRYCAAERGDVLFVKALTLHRSSASEMANPRRAIRVDYASA